MQIFDDFVAKTNLAPSDLYPNLIELLSAHHTVISQLVLLPSTSSEMVWMLRGQANEISLLLAALKDLRAGGIPRSPN